MLLETTVNLEQMGRAAKLASRQLATLPSQVKNQALLAIADEIEAQAGRIMAENALDMAEGRARGLSDALLDRLLLTPARVAALAADTRHVATLPDPVGADFESRLLPNGLRLSKRRIPIGVIGVIYEARPNVTIDVATLCLKTGNASILRGGKETLRSNLALVRCNPGSPGADRLALGCRPVHRQHRPRPGHTAAAPRPVRGYDHSPRRRRPAQALP